MFDDRLEHALRRGERTGERAALLFVDLDGFKAINDTVGHDAGDLLLQRVAMRLQQNVRSGDSLCRLGGDEFTVILEGGDPMSDGVRLARRIVDACSQPFSIGEHTLRLSASVGIALQGRHGDDSRALLKNADRAMYANKARRKAAFAQSHSLSTNDLGQYRVM